jgi:hypothetical protein
MEKHLHIVAFNVPLPANYGGVIDVFYRLKALAEHGVRIHLHCFDYGRGPAAELERWCEEVHYYRRDMSPLRMLDRRPFIVASRHSEELVQRLMADCYPILLEGLHCCLLLEDERLLRDRLVMVRAHNIEADYYGELAAAERRLGKRLYLKLEARKLRRYEPVLRKADAVLAISAADRQGLEAMGCGKVLLSSGMHPFGEVTSRPGRGDYALYHGNLAVAENYHAVEYLLDKVFEGTGHRLVVAGNEPPAWLRERVERMENVELVASPDDATMQRLVAEAQVCVMVTGQATGLKLKLLNSLYAGRFCLVNSAMVAGTGLEGLCTVADTPETMRAALERLMQENFGEAQLQVRREGLRAYGPQEGIKPILGLLAEGA